MKLWILSVNFDRPQYHKRPANFSKSHELPLEILVTTNNMSALQDSRVDARLGEVSGGDETVVAAANDESRVLGARKAAAQAALS